MAHKVSTVIVFYSCSVGLTFHFMLDVAHLDLRAGTAVFSFEGIGLVLPMYESLNGIQRNKFTQTLAVSFVGMVCCACPVFYAPSHVSVYHLHSCGDVAIFCLWRCDFGKCSVRLTTFSLFSNLTGVIDLFV